MRRVILESPFGAPNWQDILENIDYARRCVADCIRRGDAPFASHLIYTQPGILRDHDPAERRLGMEAGFEWIYVADATVVYTDRGISPGMEQGIQKARCAGLPIEYRQLKP